MCRDGGTYPGCDGSARSRWSSKPARSAHADVGGHGLANFRVGLRGNRTWDVYAWIKNAFDRDYFEQLDVATGGNTGLVMGQAADPLTCGLTVRAEC